MKNPNIHRILTSTELFDEPLSFNVIATTSKFRSENPKLYAAFLAALKDATDFINADKRKGAEIYLKVSGDKSSVDDIMSAAYLRTWSTPSCCVSQIGFLCTKPFTSWRRTSGRYSPNFSR